MAKVEIDIDFSPIAGLVKELKLQGCQIATLKINEEEIKIEQDSRHSNFDKQQPSVNDTE